MSVPPTDWNGLLVLDKPSGITSRDAINRIQRTLPRRIKIGHTGTLDPLATGVLVVCVGHATRLAEYVQAMPKTYSSTILLGATSDTDDADGTISPVPGAKPPRLDEVSAGLARFCGSVEQIPPTYSAALIDGRRAYDLARSGAEIELKSRRVQIHRIDLRRYEWPQLDVEVHCGKGTYIRSLARDLGASLGCGGLVAVLRRTQVGPFTTEQAVSLEADLPTIASHLQSMSAAVAELPHSSLDETEANQLRSGRAICFIAPAGEVALFVDGRFIGIAVSDGRSLRPTKMLPVG